MHKTEKNEFFRLWRYKIKIQLYNVCILCNVWLKIANYILRWSNNNFFTVKTKSFTVGNLWMSFITGENIENISKKLSLNLFAQSCLYRVRISRVLSIVSLFAFWPYLRGDYSRVSGENLQVPPCSSTRWFGLSKYTERKNNVTATK